MAASPRICLVALVLIFSICHTGAISLQSSNSTVPATNIPTLEFNGELILGSVLVFLGGLLCAGGGIGGGGIYLSVFVLLLGMSPHVAVPLSKITIVGVAIGGYIVNHRKRHPTADRPLIDYDTACLMEPMTLIGSIIGVYMNVVFPAYLIVVFLTLLLSTASYRTIRKGIRLYRKERSGENTPTAAATDAEYAALKGDMDFGQSLAADELVEQERTIPVKAVLIVAAMLVVVLVLSLLKGGKGASIAGVTCGTTVYWVLVGLSAPVCIFASWWAARRIQRKQAIKSAPGSGWQAHEGDVDWNPAMTIKVQLLSVLAGVAAGFLGIGGGMVKGPVMLEVGLVPMVASATSAFMIIFTSTSTSVQFIILGRIPWTLGLWYAAIGVCSASLGHIGVAYVVKKYKRQSYVAFLLGGTIALSAAVMIVVLLLNIASGKVHMQFLSVCHGE